jgi:ferric-dicitrate binding protein FerR (iron transport regulator)
MNREKTDFLMEDLIYRYFEGKATEEEKRKLLQWLDENQANQHYFILLKKAYIEISSVLSDNSLLSDAACNKFLNRIKECEKKQKNDYYFRLRQNLRKTLRYAAIILLVLTCGLIGYRFGSKAVPDDSEIFSEIVVPYGGRSVLTLPDGSKVWLNAGSHLKYKRNFNIKERDVYLNGEAFFEVKKQHTPFVVHTSYVDIKALGTAFNVKSYAEENKVEATLVEGKISIENKKTNKSFVLKPKQKIVFKMADQSSSELNNVSAKQQVNENEFPASSDINNEKAIQNITINNNVNIKETISWKDGDLIINKETLEELTKKLERKYNISFVFETNDLKNYTYTGTLRDFPLEQVLKAIEMTSPVKYTIKEKTVKLSYNKNFRLLN